MLALTGTECIANKQTFFFIYIDKRGILGLIILFIFVTRLEMVTKDNFPIFCNDLFSIFHAHGKDCLQNTPPSAFTFFPLWVIAKYKSKSCCFISLENRITLFKSFFLSLTVRKDFFSSFLFRHQKKTKNE